MSDEGILSKLHGIAATGLDTTDEDKQDEFDEDSKFNFGSGDYSGSGWASGDESENTQASELVGQLLSE